MNAKPGALQTVFTKNRTEELGYDVWEHFVVPPFFDRLYLYDAKKPCVIIGGRGCGKTMLLRYLSHQSTFSTRRPTVPADAIRHIGLYWRADTQFAKLMTGRGIADDVWDAAFGHLIALVLGIQVLQSLKSIAASKSDILDEERLLGLSLERLKAYDAAFSRPFHEVFDTLESKLCEFEVWVSNVRKRPEPTFLPGPRFLVAMIEAIKAQVATLGGSVYYVYLDEYENLHEYQQRIVNTYLKHSEMPLIFNLAMKRYGLRTPKTVGEESIIDIADYRTHDLEKYLEDDFQLFAAEVLFLNLAIVNAASSPVDPHLLRDVGSLPYRRDPKYRETLLRHARSLFPGLSHEELASTVFEDGALRRKLQARVRHALKERNSSIPADSFVRPDFPQASITASALLYRSKPTPEEVAQELDLLAAGQDNRFTGATEWVHNNFIGCLLALYESHSRACPFYAGFDTFCQMARGNLRHFLELCHKSVNQLVRAGGEVELRVPQKEQALAARQASAAFLGEIRSFGRQGNRLHTFILRLGSLFALAHRSLTQSEPERSHFAVVRGKAMSDQDHEFLHEAIKWSVLFEEEETKVKDQDQPSNFEFVLNPIYAPYFCITYRKKRKLELSSEEFEVLKDGNYDQVSALLKRYAKTWSVELPNADPTLFSHLLQEGA